MISDLTPTTLLLVDDDERFRTRLARAFTERGYAVWTAEGYDQAMAIAREDAPERAIIDLRMPGKSGLELLRDLKALEPATEIVMLTGYGAIATAVDAIRLGAKHYLPKPATADEILAAFEQGDGDPLAGTEHPLDAPSLARTEWEHINRVLADCGGNISEAARRLGIHRRSLQRKLQKYPPP